MLTFKILGRTAIPVRAIPFITGSTFNARDVSRLFFDPESYAGAEFSPRTKAFRVDAAGKFSPVKAGEWGRAARHFEDQGDRAFVELEHIGWLPAATFVWQRPFKILYDFLAKLRSQAEMTGRARSIAGEFGWLPDCKLTPEERSVVWEGFVAESHVDGGASARDVAAKDAAADAAAKIRRDKFNFNPEWQAHVDRIAARCVAEGKPVPFKRDIAAQLARQLGEKPATIARRTRSPRKQVPGTPEID